MHKFMRVNHYHSKTQWLFTDRPSTVVYTSRDVIELRNPILFVMHAPDDGSWIFFSSPSAQDAEARIVALDEIVYSDPSVFELADLPRGWIATRETFETLWQRYPIASKSCVNSSLLGEPGIKNYSNIVEHCFLLHS